MDWKLRITRESKNARVYVYKYEPSGIVSLRFDKLDWFKKPPVVGNGDYSLSREEFNVNVNREEAFLLIESLLELLKMEDFK